MAQTFPPICSRFNHFDAAEAQSVGGRAIRIRRAFGVLVGCHLWYRNVCSRTARRCTAELDPYGNALTIDLRRRIRFDLWITRLGDHRIRRPCEIGANFDTFVRELTQGIDGVRNINIAPAGIVRFVYPRAGNEAILGRDLLTTPARRPQ